MDFSFQTIHNVIHPTAAFIEADRPPSLCSSDEDGRLAPAESDETNQIDWASSQLNPKNRIDSLEPLAQPLWRLDGSTGFGTQYFVVPLFLANRPPMRIDVFILEGALYPQHLREALDLDQAFSIKDVTRLRRLGISQHILRILQWHTIQPDGALRPEIMTSFYERGPFGSRIIIEHLCSHVHESRVHIYPNYPLEEDLLPYHELLAMWGLSDPREKELGTRERGQQVDDRGGGGEEEETWLPREVDIHNVVLVRQLQDSVCEVHIRGDDEYERRLIVLKSLNSSVKYMYHELRTLLCDVPPHEHVIGRPRHVITKTCMFGGKRGVVGFTIPYHPVGTLRDVLPVLRLHGRLLLADQMRWSQQLVRAMCHIWHRGHVYYPDLRLDNIVLSSSSGTEAENETQIENVSQGDVVVIDFEQRGVWSGFSAPEVDFVENVRILAFDDPDMATAAAHPDQAFIPEAACERAREDLAASWLAARAADSGREGEKGAEKEAEKYRGTEAGPKHDLASVTDYLVRLEEATRYTNPRHGYNVTWICLTPREQEAALVYMLGRVLWCIFEGTSAPHRGAVWQSYRWEPEDVEFPACRHTPPQVRALIARCLGSSTDLEAMQEHNQFVRLRGKVYIKEAVEGNSPTSPTSPTGYRLVADNIVDRARRYWQAQLAAGDAWLRERHRRLTTGQDEAEGSRGSAQGRLSLQQVSDWLDELARDGTIAS